MIYPFLFILKQTYLFKNVVYKLYDITIKYIKFAKLSYIKIKYF